MALAKAALTGGAYWTLNSEQTYSFSIRLGLTASKAS